MELSGKGDQLVNRKCNTFRHNGGHGLESVPDQGTNNPIPSFTECNRTSECEYLGYKDELQYHEPPKQVLHESYFDLSPEDKSLHQLGLPSARTPRDDLSVGGHPSEATRPVLENGDLEPDIWYDVSTGFDRYSSYAPIIVNKDLRCETDRSSSFPANELGSQLNIPGWLHELSYENDTNLYNYLSFGVENGFLIVDNDADIPEYECENYRSVSSGPAHNFVDKLIHTEMENGKYIITHTKPHCIHALGAVPKKDTKKWRPITDCKRPIDYH